MTDASTDEHADLERLVRRHLRFGWWTLLVFLTLGIVLEALHGFKVGLYMDVDNHTRRLMWTLAHAHGTLVSLIQIAFGLSLGVIRPPSARPFRVPSVCLMGAGVLIPMGFFLGGMIFYSGDPGLGILLLPVGAVLLFVAVLLTALRIGGRQDRTDPPAEVSPNRPKRRRRR